MKSIEKPRKNQWFLMASNSGMFNSRVVSQIVFDDLTESEYLQDDLMMILEKCSKERHASEFTIFDNDRLDKKRF